MAFKSVTSSPDLFHSFLASPPKNETLETVATLVHWDRVRDVMAPAYKPRENNQVGGREGFDPVLLFKMLLLEQWYALSDGDCVFMAADSLSFRRFLGLSSSDKVPDDTTLVKFRGRLRTAGLYDKVFAEITVQMEERGLGIREGSVRIIDATLIHAAVRPPAKPKGDKPAPPPLDPDADFTVKGGKPIHGFKLHLGQDRETGLIVGHVTTPASVHDSQVFEELLDGQPAEVLADKAYDSAALRAMAKGLGIVSSVMRKAKRNTPLTAWRKGRNASIGRVRSFIEGTNATLKRFMGCGRAVYRGLVRVGDQMTMGVLAYNLRRYCAILG